jgi:hypothetical protein
LGGTDYENHANADGAPISVEDVRQRAATAMVATMSSSETQDVVDAFDSNHSRSRIVVGSVPVQLPVLSVLLPSEQVHGDCAIAYL